MIRYEPTSSQEQQLREEYVNSDYTVYNGYRCFVLTNVPGVADAVYRSGDDPHWIEFIVFAEEKHLAWFMLRYS